MPTRIRTTPEGDRRRGTCGVLHPRLHPASGNDLPRRLEARTRDLPPLDCPEWGNSRPLLGHHDLTQRREALQRAASAHPGATARCGASSPGERRSGRRLPQRRHRLEQHRGAHERGIGRTCPNLLDRL